MKNLFLVFVCLEFYSSIFGQKPSIDSTALRNWPTIRSGYAAITNDGNYAMFTAKSSFAESNTLVIQSTRLAWKKEFPGVVQGVFSPDSKTAIFLTTAHRLSIFALGELISTDLDHVSSYRLLENGSDEYLLYELETSPQKLILRNLSTSEEVNFEGVVNFVIDEKQTVLLYQTKEQNKDGGESYSLHWMNLQDKIEKIIWQADCESSNHTFDAKGNQLVFIGKEKVEGREVNQLVYYNTAMTTAVPRVGRNITGVDSNLEVKKGELLFSKDCTRVFFNLIGKMKAEANGNFAKVDVWSYKDTELQSEQLQQDKDTSMVAIINLNENCVVPLLREKEKVFYDNDHLYNNAGDYILVLDNKGVGLDFWWDKNYLPSLSLVSTKDGSRRILKDSMDIFQGRYYKIPGSPNGRWIIYFDGQSKAFFSCQIPEGVTRNITRTIRSSLINENGMIGFAGWLQSGMALIYDEYDIWEVDPAGIKDAVNITQGYGRKHRIKFRMMTSNGIADSALGIHDDIFLAAFNTINKYNGVYKILLGRKADPQQLTMGPYRQYCVGSQVQRFTNNSAFVPIKARDAHIWIVRRESNSVAPNYYTTEDFIVYKPLSQIKPERNYTWLTAELIHWKMPTGTYSTGILYKPENFDKSKTYPIIFNYYEQKSDQLFEYLDPGFTTSDINIPYFVSKGYLVFTPDITYKTAEIGESVKNVVVSAAAYLSKMPWINSKKMGINGHSFGGYETNYLVTHTHMFAAAVEGSGVTDIISAYATLWNGDRSMQGYFEIGQGRMGKDLWKGQEFYLKNSPILSANRATTPLLMMHNKGDIGVRWLQGVEFITAFRRLGKRAWMLQYDEGAHGVNGKDAEDFTIRVTQFFDHYLKGYPPPKWMTVGIPARLKGIDMGYELDMSGQKP
jgi:dienelactone hydrolase